MPIGTSKEAGTKPVWPCPLSRPEWQGLKVAGAQGGRSTGHVEGLDGARVLYAPHDVVNSAP
jgi:hypothetical protein